MGKGLGVEVDKGVGDGVGEGDAVGLGVGEIAGDDEAGGSPNPSGKYCSFTARKPPGTDQRVYLPWRKVYHL